MAIVKDYLDPNATTYTDLSDLDSTAAIKLASIAEGAEVNPTDLAALDPTADTKLATVEAGATADQTGEEVRDAIVGLPDDDRQIIVSRPTTGQFKVYAIQRHTDGKTESERSDTAEV